MALDRDNTKERNKAINDMYTELSAKKVPVKLPGKGTTVLMALKHDDVVDAIAKAFFLKRRTVDEILAGAYERRWAQEAAEQQADPNQINIFQLPGVGDDPDTIKK